MVARKNGIGSLRFQVVKIEAYTNACVNLNQLRLYGQDNQPISTS